MSIASSNVYTTTNIHVSVEVTGWHPKLKFQEKSEWVVDPATRLGKYVQHFSERKFNVEVVSAVLYAGANDLDKEPEIPSIQISVRGRWSTKDGRKWFDRTDSPYGNTLTIDDLPRDVARLIVEFVRDASERSIKELALIHEVSVNTVGKKEQAA